MAAVVLDNQRLAAQAEVSIRELRRSRARIASSAARERRRIERDLHDGAQQRLVALSLQLRMIRSDIRRDPDQAEQLAASASDELAQSLKERTFAAGDTIYVPTNTVHQFVNEDDEPLILLVGQNRIFKHIGYDKVVVLEPASDVRAVASAKQT